MSSADVAAGVAMGLENTLRRFHESRSIKQLESIAGFIIVTMMTASRMLVIMYLSECSKKGSLSRKEGNAD